MPVAEKLKVSPVIGLEVHAQLATASKMFCPCPTTFAAEPNSATCPICLGFPGTLPVVNREAVALAVRFGLAVGAKVHRQSRFARKNYFYPDLPKGYQITQFDQPVCTGGSVEVEVGSVVRSVPLVRAHLEEDAGKSLHENPFPDVPDTVTLVEWNRSGVPLLEIVTEPAIRSSAEAMAYLTELRKLLRALSISDANMEEGNLRCDANISVRLSESDPYGTRVEVKNMNSIRNVGRAIEHEIERQAEAIAARQAIVQETRLFDAATSRTRAMRSKEEAHDYRYFPEPDLGTLEIAEEWITEIGASLRETPRAKKARLVAQYEIPEADAELFASARPLAEYFEAVASSLPPRLASSWVAGEVLRRMKDRGLSPEDTAKFSVSPAALADLLRAVESGEVSGSAAKVAFEEMVSSGKPAAEVIRSKNLALLSDTSALLPALETIVRENGKQVALYRSGKKTTLGWFVGQAMKATGGRAEPALLTEMLRKLLDE
ncbi:MAG: Asp-tRNA(Asn)/Glu-tRNA(Gln) amidotransferase subunit GatB [Thermoanaerobaculia bacterium]